MDYITTSAKREIAFGTELQRGASGQAVKRVQEWLNLRGHGTAIDGKFGPATEAALKQFESAQRRNPPIGIVDAQLFAALTEPLRDALRQPALTAGLRFSNAVWLIAMQHLKLHPREIGGENRGPWVRLYMQGNEGVAWPWCAGFVTFVMQQAAALCNCTTPIKGSFSCDLLATQAIAAGRLQHSPPPDDEAGGCWLFLVRKSAGDWSHTGFAFDFHDGAFASIEGNTNDQGGREGYEVCARHRGSNGMDFVRLD